MLSFDHFCFSVLENVHKTHHTFWLGPDYSIPFHLKLFSVHLGPPLPFCCLSRLNFFWYFEILGLLHFSSLKLRYSRHHTLHDSISPPPPRDSEISEFSAFSILGLSSATTWPKSGHSEDEGKTSSRNVRINFTLHCINTRKSFISSVMLYPEYLYLFIFFHINV